MRVIDLGSKSIFRWRVEIPRENKNSVDDLKDWLGQTGIEAAWVPGLIFFREEQHVTHFILRWS